MREKVACSLFVREAVEDVLRTYPCLYSGKALQTLLQCRVGAIEFWAVLCAYEGVSGDEPEGCVNVGHDDSGCLE